MLWRGFWGSVCVLIGGMIISMLPSSTPIMGWDLLQALRGSMPGRMLGVALCAGGLALTGSSWLTLCRLVARNEALVAENLALVHRAVILWCLPLLLAPPLFSRDGWSYAAQGMMTRVGKSPYEYGPGVLEGSIIEAVDPLWLATGTPYGPLPLMFGSVVAHFTGSPWVLVVAHRLAALAGLAMLAWAVPRMARWSGTNPALASGLVLASPLMLANGAGGLHNDLLMVGLMALALVVGIEKHWVWGAVLGGAAAAIKVPGGVVCIAIALACAPAGASLLSRVGSFARVGIVSLGTLVGLGFLSGVGFGWLEALTVPGIVKTPLSMPTVVGAWLDGVASGIGLQLRPDTMLRGTRTVATVASLLFVPYVALRAPTGNPDRALKWLSVLLAVTIALSPVVHLWYFLWLIPFVAPQRLSRAGMLWVLGISVVLGVVAPLNSELDGAYNLIITAVILATITLGVLMATRRSRERLERIADAEWLPRSNQMAGD